MTTRINPLVLCFLPVIFLLVEGRSQPCVDDRIVFPKDSDDDVNSHSKLTYLSENSTTTTTVAPSSTVTPLLEMETNITEAVSTASEKLINRTTTEKPVIDNRILFETTPKCKEGFELRANRCRKSA
ncbi:uncharacterized protein LOC128253690 [Drosophila gunungcola]|uniref:uncharacterized protein LOC128253690 n=1 Tax=Drosophila gunungcola TaxID=103775 RepID=UPI0022E2457B|nr:uncharacterized protein LOC128253690 [Drosophila gunungcola]